MTSQPFHVGQTAYLRPSLARNAAAGAYEIRAVLPQEGGGPRYRIKSLIERHERRVPSDRHGQDLPREHCKQRRRSL
jgi:hypothetical protein